MEFCKYCSNETNLTKVPERIFKQIRCQCHKDIGYHVVKEHNICDKESCNIADKYTTLTIEKDKLDQLQLPYSIITIYNVSTDMDAEPIELIVEGGFAEYHVEDYIQLAAENELEGRYLITLENMIGNLNIEMELHAVIFVMPNMLNETLTARIAHLSNEDLNIWQNKRR